VNKITITGNGKEVVVEFKEFHITPLLVALFPEE